jgi:hypothetical protein
MAAAMGEAAGTQPGYLGIEDAHEQLGITVSYWNARPSVPMPDSPC